MNPDDISETPENVQESAVRKVPKAPDKKKFEAKNEEISKAIKEKELQLRGVSQKPDESVQEKLRSLRTEKEAKIGKRKKIDSDMRTLNQEISKKNADLTKIQSTLQGYKSESRIDEAIQRLEDQLKRNNFKISEERKIVAEIDLLRRSKKTLIGFTTVKRELDAMRDQLRLKREERDHCYKVVTSVKLKEEELKRGIQQEKLASDTVKRELEELKEQRRMLQQEQRIQEKEYASWRNEQQRTKNQQQRRRREEERMAREQKYIREMAEYEASREPYEDQKQLCMTLITYLQSLTPADHSDATGSGDSHDATQSENIDLAQSFEKDGLVLLKKKEEDLFTGKPRNSKRSKKDKRRNKPLVHTPQTLSQFQQMEIKAPSVLGEVQETIQQLMSKKAYYDSLPVTREPSSSLLDTIHSDQSSAGAPSVTESAFNESIPSTPEVLLDSLAPSFAPEGMRRLSHDSGACELEEQEETCLDGGNTKMTEARRTDSSHSSGDSSTSSAPTVMELNGEDTEEERTESMNSEGSSKAVFIDSQLGAEPHLNDGQVEADPRLNCRQIGAEPQLNDGQVEAEPILSDGLLKSESKLNDGQVGAKPKFTNLNYEQSEVQPELSHAQLGVRPKVISEAMQDMTIVCDTTTTDQGLTTTSTDTQTSGDGTV